MTRPMFADVERVPALGDPSWAAMTAPLVAYLATPRTTDAVLAWAHEQGIAEDRARHMLAFLAVTNAATWDGSTWRAR